MKPPRYLRITPHVTAHNTLEVEIEVAWWGWPLLLYHDVRHRHDVRWYEWPVVGWVILKLWWRVLREEANE